MQHRAHVLHKLLEGFVQRRGFKVLQTALPPKEEHVLMVRLTTFQRGLYIRFMQRFTEAGAAGWCNTNPLKAFSVACKVIISSYIRSGREETGGSAHQVYAEVY